MSFLYPRTIAITRPTHPEGKGAVGYGGQLRSTEEPVEAGIAASIQLSRDGKAPLEGLPGDGRQTLWRVFFNRPNGTVRRHDVITDDLGRRFQVIGDYWNSLGYNLLCQSLEA